MLLTRLMELIQKRDPVDGLNFAAIRLWCTSTFWGFIYFLNMSRRARTYQPARIFFKCRSWRWMLKMGRFMSTVRDKKKIL